VWFPGKEGGGRTPDLNQGPPKTRKQTKAPVSRQDKRGHSLWPTGGGGTKKRVKEKKKGQGKKKKGTGKPSRFIKGEGQPGHPDTGMPRQEKKGVARCWVKR